MRRVAAVDVGTNSVLLLIAERRQAAIVSIVERATITRLGQGVDRTRRLAEAAVERTLACLADYRELIASHGVASTEAVCTSAARDATNGGAFLKRAGEALGAELVIISGTREAELTFAGALSGLDANGHVTVCDIGGGSTEIIVGRRDDTGAHLERAVSLDVGSVRLFERHVRSDPPRADEIAAIRATVRRALDGVEAPLPATTLVGVAGTVTTLAAVELALQPYDPSRVHGATLSRDAVDGLLDRLAALPLDERRALPGLEPGRADVIVAGAALVAELLDWACARALLVSDRGVRWGLVHGALQ